MTMIDRFNCRCRCDFRSRWFSRDMYSMPGSIGDYNWQTSFDSEMIE